MKDIAQRLTDFVNEHLPTAQAMDIAIADYDGEVLTLQAPLSKSYNDKLTAFGGSLYVVCVMAGWGMVYLRCLEAGLNPNIVVARGDIHYHAPVDRDIVAASVAIDESHWQDFFARYAERGRAKIELSARVVVDGTLAVEFTGLYAILGEK